MIGAIVGGGLALLTLGYFIVEICFPVQWRTAGVWLLTSLVGIPAGLLVVAAFAAYPPLIILALIVAFVTNPKR